MNNSPIKLPPQIQAKQCIVDIHMFARSTNDDAWMYPIQLEKATSHRKNEFAAGRYCASRSLEMLGIDSVVGVNEDRSPIWPNSVSGSIAHSDHFAWSVVARKEGARGVGIDLEQIVTWKTLQEIKSRIVKDEELLQLVAAGFDERTAFTLAFSAKEAVYKCVYPNGLTDIEFHDLRIEPIRHESLRVSFCSQDHNGTDRESQPIHAPLEVDFAIEHDHVFTFCSLPAESPLGSAVHSSLCI